jgi:hypothetical protein
VVPKLQGLISKYKTLLPKEKKLPIGKRVGSGMLYYGYFPTINLTHIMVQPAQEMK